MKRRGSDETHVTDTRNDSSGRRRGSRTVFGLGIETTWLGLGKKSLVMLRMSRN